MKVRCVCGRYMRRSRVQHATAASGGAWNFACGRCVAEAVVYSRHGVDDEPIAGVVLTRDGMVELVYDEVADEWRPHRKGLLTMTVTYDVFRAHDFMGRAVDALCDGLWNEVESERDDIIVEAKARLDDAAALLSEKLDGELHPYVSSEDVAYLAAALALRELEDWDVVVEQVLYQVEQEAAHWYQVDLERGD